MQFLKDTDYTALAFLFYFCVSSFLGLGLLAWGNLLRSVELKTVETR